METRRSEMGEGMGGLISTLLMLMIMSGRRG
jgi:hypothetical protein